MERPQILELMGNLKLYGMRSAYDEVMASGIKRQQEPPRIIGDLLSAEIAEKQARSIKYQLTVAKLPLAKDLDDFDFADTPVNEGLVRELATGTFAADQRNVVLVGGTGTGKSHLAIAIARAFAIGLGPMAPSMAHSATARAVASSTSSIWSIDLKRKPAAASRGGSRIISPASTSRSWTNSAICPSPRPADSCSST